MHQMARRRFRRRVFPDQSQSRSLGSRNPVPWVSRNPVPWVFGIPFSGFSERSQNVINSQRATALLTHSLVSLFLPSIVERHQIKRTRLIKPKRAEVSSCYTYSYTWRLLVNIKQFVPSTRRLYSGSGRYPFFFFFVCRSIAEQYYFH